MYIRYVVLLASVLVACGDDKNRDDSRDTARAPSISLFSATPEMPCAGDSVSLTYRFANGTGVITPGNLPASGESLTLTISETTVFTLTVTNDAGKSVSAEVTVMVTSLPDATITAPTSVSADATGVSASVPVQENVTYAWGVSTGNATLTAGSTSPAVTFDVTGTGSSVNLTVNVVDTITTCVAHGERSITLTPVLTECGDGELTNDEECDDGGTDPLDGCDGDCNVELGYACSSESGAASVCLFTCGDGVIDDHEECDDDELTGGDGCSAVCQVERGFVCDNSSGLSMCATTCGDGIVAGIEACDDNDTSPGDGCDDVCQLELGFDCGDEPTACSPICGDGLIVLGEGCDDDDTDPSDGCDASCQVEFGYDCSGEPSICEAPPASQVFALAFGGEEGATQAIAVGTDSENNVIIAGNFNGTISLDPDDAKALHNVATNSTFDIFVAKFSPTGEYLWSVAYGDGEATSAWQSQRAWAVATDSNDDIFITGDFSVAAANGGLDFGGSASLLTSTGSAVYVAKLSGADGTGVWAVQAGGTGVGDFGKGLAIDSNDDVIVVGSFSSATLMFPSTLVTPAAGDGSDDGNGQSDVFVEKLSGTTGDALWNAPKTFGSAGSNQMAAAVVLDRDPDNIDGFILTGSFAGTLNFGASGGTAMGTAPYTAEVFVAKLDADGAHVFSRHFGAPSGNGYGVATDSAGNVFLVGQFDTSVDFGNSVTISAHGNVDAFVAKLDTAGVAVWAHALGSTAQDDGLGLAIDSQDNVICTGVVGGNTDLGGGTLTAKGASDAFALKLTNDGAHVWSHLYGDGSYQFARGVAVDGNDHVALTGYFTGSMNFGAGAIEPVGLGYGAYVGVLTP